MKTGLFFGTFNPIHNGHIAIAEFMANKTDLEEVWFVVSPHNPLKEKEDLLEDKARLALVRAAIKNYPKLKADDSEFYLPKPSYTIYTLEFLEKKYPQRKFVLIIGEDNLRSFSRWKKHKKILENFELYVYPRNFLSHENTVSTEEIMHPQIKKFDIRLLNISATEIRKALMRGENVSELIPVSTLDAIRREGYYLNKKTNLKILSRKQVVRDE